jgi:hypothetical protein
MRAFVMRVIIPTAERKSTEDRMMLFYDLPKITSLFGVDEFVGYKS